MLLTTKDMKYLENDYSNKNGGFRFIGKGMATEEEKKRLKRLDDFSLENRNKHLINNYEDLD